MLHVAFRPLLLSHKTFGPRKPGLHSVPFWQILDHFERTLGASIRDPCSLMRVRTGMLETQTLICGRKIPSSEASRLCSERLATVMAEMF